MNYTFLGNKRAVHAMALMMVIDVQLNVTDEFFNRKPDNKNDLNIPIKIGGY